MSLRIAREEVYLPLPISIEHAMSMYGRKDYLVPLEETRIPEWVLNELREIGVKTAARGLVFIDSGIEGSGVPTVEGGFGVAYSVLCGLAMKNGAQHIRMSRIMLVDFNLCWKAGKFYQQENPKGKEMKKPTNVQMSFLDKTARDLFAKHGITTAEFSRVNPFLQVFIIPTVVGEAKVKAFANDLFHSLNVLPDDETIAVAEANHYCALDVDNEQGCYLVVFNHPAIFDYPEDSPEGGCAYGVWKRRVG